MEIKRLESDVISKIRSSSNVNSVAQCVCELICNSLDAKSTSIAIRVNLITFRIQVADNGEGITRDNMEHLGTRYMTSKCQRLDDLRKNLKTYGFRGEALVSILEQSTSIHISSRFESSMKTYAIMLSNKHRAEVKLAKHRESIGTTVTVVGWLSEAPVRQKMIVPEIEMGEVKKTVERLIIINPKTSFTLRNDITGLLLLNSPKHDDIIETFCYLHPEISRKSFTLLKASRKNITIELLVKKELNLSRLFQYIYVNRRPVNSSKLTKHIHKAFNGKTIKNSLLNTKQYPLYVMNIKCPPSYVDNLMTEVEFTHWNLVLACVDTLLRTFLGKENCEEIESKKPKTKKTKSEEKIHCGVSQLFGAVQASAYKRMTQSDNGVRNNDHSTNGENLDEGYSIDEAFEIRGHRLDDVAIKNNIIASEEEKNRLLKRQRKEQPYRHDNAEKQQSYRKKDKSDVIPKQNKFMDKILGRRRKKQRSIFHEGETVKITKNGEKYRSDLKNDYLVNKQTSRKKDWLINENTVDSCNYKIEDSGQDQRATSRMRKSIMKKPKPLNIQLHQAGCLETTEFDQRSVYSRLNNEEDKGKNLIMDMFLKSTQVFKGEENEQTCNVSRETIEESNFVFENNVQDTRKGIDTTMSISVNVKRRRSKKNIPDGEIRKNFIRQKSFLTAAISDNKLMTYAPVKQKVDLKRKRSYQTELAERLDGFSLREQRRNLRSDYTVLLNTINKKQKYVFSRQNRETTQIEEGMTFRPLRICHCLGDDDEEKMFSFQERKDLSLTAKKVDDDEGLFKKPISPSSRVKTLVRNTSIFERTGSSVLKPCLRVACEKSPFFTGTGRDIELTFKCFQPLFKSTQMSGNRGRNNGRHSNDLIHYNRNVFNYNSWKNNNNNYKDNDVLFNMNCEIVDETNLVFNKENKKFDIYLNKVNWPMNIVDQDQNMNEANLYTQKNLNNNNLFDFDRNCSPNIFSLEHCGGFISKRPSSKLEISIPNEVEMRDAIENELLIERKKNEDVVISSDWDRKKTSEQERSRIIVDSQNEWVKRQNEHGERFFVNLRTGMVTARTPHVTQSNFDFDERLDFIPKGMSPVLKGHKEIENTLSEMAKSRLHDFILQGYEDELLVVKWKNFTGNDTKKFFEEIYEAKSKLYENAIPSIHESSLKIPKNWIAFCTGMFKSLELVGQLDKKFIVVREKTKELLILFDQHAVHERIRLERLLKEYKGIKAACQGNLTIFLPHCDLALLKKHSVYIESLGLGVVYFTNGIHVTHIPLCVREKFDGQVNSEDLNQVINMLVKDTVDFLKITRGSTSCSLPRIIQDIINLKACRGAIKFGDALSTRQCLDLLTDLATCQLPFQCAHGRPTLTPLIHLTKIRPKVKDKKLHLKKLVSVSL